MPSSDKLALFGSLKPPTLKGFGSREGSKAVSFDLNQVQGLLIHLFVTYDDSLLQPRRQRSWSDIFKDVKSKD